MGSRLRAEDLHRLMVGRWAPVLRQLGIDDTYLRNRHMPCPVCGGKDRFRWDNREGKGTFFCSQCGAGDGFKLLQNVHGWSFRDAMDAVASAIGVTAETIAPMRDVAPAPVRPEEPARMTARVRDMLRATTTPEHVPDCIAYLQHRGVWPLPENHGLKAHAGIDYFRQGEGKARVLVGRYPALVGVIRDVNGDAISAHVTYLQNGQKATVEAPRKILSRVNGRTGCAIRLMPLNGATLGVAEGIETALAAWKLHPEVPVWATLNTSLLAKFVPPPGVHRVVIYADSDVAGLKAAWELRDELDGRCTVELVAPKEGDWADVVTA